MASIKSRILVYIVFHKHWDYVEECLKSIRTNRESYEFDVLVVNTTPGDEDLERLEVLCGDYPVVTIAQKLPNVVHEIYEEYLDCYEYIMRVDADDFLYPRAVKQLHESLAKSDDCGAAYGAWSVVDASSRVVREIIPPADGAGLGFHGACTLFRTAYLKGLDLSAIGIDSQDGYATFMFFQVNATKSLMIDALIFGYRRHSSNITGDKTRLLRSRCEILAYFYAQVSEAARCRYEVVLIDTKSDDLSPCDREFLNAFTVHLASDGFSTSKEGRVPIPSQMSLRDFFNQGEANVNFIFVNVRKLGVGYFPGLVASFVQYVSMLKPKIGIYVEPITNRVLTLNESGVVSPLNVDGSRNSFCFSELNGLHSYAQEMYIRDCAMYSHEILNKIVEYDF